MTTPDVDAAVPGLRARSKAKRRALIQRTAMRLFAEQGYDGTTIAEIAEAADVAPRTVSGYFPSKLELATSNADDMAGRATKIFEDHPELDLLSVFDLWLTGEDGAFDPELAALSQAMYEANPSIRALGSAHVARAAELADDLLSRELGRPLVDPMVKICGAAMAAALAAYITRVTASGASTKAHDEMMTFLRGLMSAARRS